jgi:dolichyl-phosphate beta-glucosyltransferase
VSAVELSIVIPAFDEEERIGPFLDEIVAWASGRSGVEVVVVDDGSSDDTVRVVNSYTQRLPALTVHLLGDNQGKGAAVRRGLAAARGRHRVFLDADGSTPVDEVDTLLEATRDRDDVVAMGSIAVEGSSVDQSQLAVRQWAGRLGNRLIQLLAVPGVRDTQRGCKLVSAAWCDEVLPLCVVDGWAFDVELLALSRAAGYQLVEVPVRWHHVKGSKVRAVSYPKTLLDVLAIRRRVRRLVRDGRVGVAPVGARSTRPTDSL